MKARPDILSAGNAKPTLTNNLFRMKNFVLQLALALSLLAGGGSTAWAAGTRQMAEETRITVSGKVIDAKRKTPLVGVNVTVEGTSTGVTTGMDGIYRIQLTPGQSLRFSYLGYADHVAKISGAVSHLDVQLEESSTSLDDVVVVAYGTQRKGDVLSSISTTGSKELMRAPVSTTSGALIGKIAGVNSRNTEGTPGSSANIQIRNLGTPLYVIDGVPCDARAFSNLESSDIESLEVLKDASAAAIYGSRGSCGVILITTKRGEGERPVVSYDGQFSVSNVSKTIDMLDAYEFARIFKEARDGAYLFNVPTGSIDDPYEDRPQTYHRVDPLITAYLQDKTGTMTDTDWQDAIFRTAYSTKHSVSVSGRTKTLGYYIGANYLYREGTIIGSDFERYSLRANIDGKRNRLKYGVSFSPSYSKTNYLSLIHI